LEACQFLSPCRRFESTERFWNLFNNWQGWTSQKNWSFSKTAVWTPNFLLLDTLYCWKYST